MSEVIVALLWSAAGLAAIFIPLERAFPARTQPILRARVGVDALFFVGQYLAWNAISLVVLSSVERLARGGLHDLQAAVAIAPLWLQAILAIVLGDFCVYWFHRACHHFDFLWRFHAVHHSSEHLDWVAAHREHPLDGILTQLSANLPVLLLGFRTEVLLVFITLRGMWAIFVHSNVRIPLGPLRWFMGAPEWHRWHHARTDRPTQNFANLAPWLDVVFRTHHHPTDEDYPLGLNTPFPKGYFAQLVEPFRARPVGHTDADLGEFTLSPGIWHRTRATLRRALARRSRVHRQAAS